MHEQARQVFDELDELLVAMAKQQERRVLALGRRLKPGVTEEDLRNAHDFRELDDPDYQYEDGTLAGVQQALSALRARRRELELGPVTDGDAVAPER